MNVAGPGGFLPRKGLMVMWECHWASPHRRLEQKNTKRLLITLLNMLSFRPRFSPAKIF